MSTIIDLAHNIKIAQYSTKVDFDGVMTRFLFRPCSYYYAALLHGVFRFNPNHVSLLSGLLGVMAVLFAWLYPSLLILIPILFSIACMDNADGALARYLGTNGPLGAVADALGGYLIVFCMPILTLIMLLKINIIYTQYVLIVTCLTLFIIALEFLGRAMHLKLMMTVKNEERQSETSSQPSLIKKITGNLNFCGFMYPTFIGSWLFGVPIIAWIYSISLSFLIGLIGIILTVKAILE